jgi:hypothetical protein
MKLPQYMYHTLRHRLALLRLLDHAWLQVVGNNFKELLQEWESTKLDVFPRRAGRAWLILICVKCRQKQSNLPADKKLSVSSRDIESNVSQSLRQMSSPAHAIP